MKKVIFSQILADNGRAIYTGLYDENGCPVRIEIEKNDDGTVMLIERTTLSEEEKNQICSMHDNCDDCQLMDCCHDEFDDYYELEGDLLS